MVGGRILLLLFLCGSIFLPNVALAQRGCYITDGGGARVFFIAHPDGNALHFTSTGAGTNYIVLNTGTYTCANYNGSTFATNTSALGAACQVRENNNNLTANGFLVTSFDVYMCPFDDYIGIILISISLLGYTIIRKGILLH